MADIRIKTAIETLSRDYKIKTRVTITEYCSNGNIPSHKKDGIWHIDGSFVEGCISWRKTARSLEELVNDTEGFHALDAGIRKLCYRNIRNHVMDKYVSKEDYFSLPFEGIFIDPCNVDAVKDMISSIVAKYQNKSSMVPVRLAAEKMDMSIYKLKKMIRDGSVPAVCLDDGWYIDANEISRFNTEKEKMIGIYDYTKQLLCTIDTVFDINDSTDRAMLNNYLKNSSLSKYIITWDDANFHGDRRNAIYIPDMYKDVLRDLIIKYLNDYGKNQERYHQLISNPYWTRHPRTLALLHQFGENKILGAAIVIMDALIHSVESEITDCTNEEITALVEYVSQAPTKNYVKFISQFVRFVKKADKCNFDIELKDDSRPKHNTVNTTAYPFEKYLAFSYLVFTDEAIKEHDIINKALSNIKYAILWLYSIWHYFAAWRTSDFYRIPLLPLRYDSDTVRDMIINGRYEEEAINISLLLESEILGKYANPEKTENVQHNKFLVVHFTETLRSVIGTAYTICLLHTAGLDKLPEQRFTFKDYLYVYGDGYIKVMGRKPFMNRRANKAYLDYIAEDVERHVPNSGKALGHYVASFVRAHVTNGDNLAETTYKYLEYKMDGLEKNEILMLLWDTGPLSFIPYMLLETLYGDSFSSLRISDQTKLIKESKVNAYQAETETTMIRKAYTRANEVVSRLFLGYDKSHNKKKIAKQVLTNILNHTALSKYAGITCICAARRVPCNNNLNCIGCAYAVYERAFFFSLLNHVKDKIQAFQAAKTEGERTKISVLFGQIYLPLIYEVLYISKATYHMEISTYRDTLLEMIEEGGILNVSN